MPSCIASNPQDRELDASCGYSTNFKRRRNGSTVESVLLELGAWQAEVGLDKATLTNAMMKFCKKRRVIAENQPTTCKIDENTT
ncbi:hypothetical protein ACVWYQ_003415 [Bradyrhizobium sp. USDA 3397]